MRYRWPVWVALVTISAWGCPSPIVNPPIGTPGLRTNLLMNTPPPGSIVSIGSRNQTDLILSAAAVLSCLRDSTWFGSATAAETQAIKATHDESFAALLRAQLGGDSAAVRALRADSVEVDIPQGVE